MKIGQKEQEFRPVVITLEKQEEIDTLRNILGALSSNMCKELGGFDTDILFDYLDNIALFKRNGVSVVIDDEE